MWFFDAKNLFFRVKKIGFFRIKAAMGQKLNAKKQRYFIKGLILSVDSVTEKCEIGFDRVCGKHLF